MNLREKETGGRLKRLIKFLIIAVLFQGPLAKAEIYYEASDETCYKKDEIDALAYREQQCQIHELDLASVEKAYRESQSRRGAPGFDWSAFSTGAAAGSVVAIILYHILVGVK